MTTIYKTNHVSTEEFKLNIPTVEEIDRYLLNRLFELVSSSDVATPERLAVFDGLMKIAGKDQPGLRNFLLNVYFSPGRIEIGEEKSLDLQGYRQFCSERPEACKPKGYMLPLAIVDNIKLALIYYTNKYVNQIVKPATDYEIYGEPEKWVDLWANDFPDTSLTGDCEDFVFLKRQLLITLGIPENALNIAFVKTRSGEGHLVLVVSTPQYGDIILDNLRNPKAGNATIYPAQDIEHVPIAQTISGLFDFRVIDGTSPSHQKGPNLAH